MDESDIETLLDVPVFAELPASHSAAHPLRDRLRHLLPAGHAADLALEAAAASDFAIPAAASEWVEALHRLRASLLLAHSGSSPHVIAITPAAPEPRPKRVAAHAEYSEEQQPSLALSLAAVLAQHGSPVLYVDADLRSAPSADVFPVAAGLSDALAGDDLPEYDHPSLTPPLLSVLSTGPRPPCPAELIASERMTALLARWRREFTFVVIDSPPAVYADALVLAQQADAVLLAAQAGKTRRNQIAPAFDALARQVPAHAALGVILADAPGGGHNARA